MTNEDRGLRVLNRDFSLGEYGESWTKLERYLFIEIYNVIKDFFIASSDENIKTFSSESILLTLPVDRLDEKLFGRNHRNRDLMNAAEGLSRKQINLKILDVESGQWGFTFISMFPEIRYDPAVDKEKDRYDAAINTLLNVKVDMLDGGKKTDYFFVHF